MGSRETLVLKIVLWAIQTFLREKYRLVTPADLNRVVDDYLAQLPKLGIKLVYERSKIGDDSDEISHSDRVGETPADPPRVSDVR